jgi:PPOX class probable F420-dependent enzyme
MLLTPEQDQYLRDHHLAVLATSSRSDGSPQVSTIRYDYDGTDIVISIKSYTAKWKNVLKQPKVGLVVNDGRRQMIVYGTAEAIDRDPQRLALTKRAGGGRGRYAEGSDEEIVKRLDEDERTVLRITPRRVLMND